MKGEWHRDGPEVKVEFVRKSGNGLLTLVLFDRAEPVRSHWVWMDAADLDSAVRNLAEREGRGRNSARRISGDGQKGARIRGSLTLSLGPGGKVPTT